MAVYQRLDSPFWWLLLERPGQLPIRESTKVPIKAPTIEQSKANRRLAEEIYHQKMNQLARERYQLPIDRPRVSFADYRVWYVQHVSVNKRNTIREISMLKQLGRTFDRLSLDAITKEDAQEWLTLRRRQVSAATVRRELEILKHLLNTAIPKYLEKNPLAGFPGKGQLRVVPKEPRILTHDEEKRLPKVLDLEDRALIVCALDTLMRLSDVTNLKRSADHRTYLTVVDPKVEVYKVPISKRLRKALDVLPKTSDWYFPKHHDDRRGDRAAQNSVIRMFQEACAAPKIPYGRAKNGMTFHCLRHTGASRGLEGGASVRTVQELGGWKNLTQLTRYTHPTDEAKRAAVEAIGARGGRIAPMN